MKFNPDVKVSDTNTPSGLGYSQGMGTNNQYKTLFEGLGSAVAGFANATDQLNQYNIYKQVRQGVDAIQAPYLQVAEDLTTGQPAATAGNQFASGASPTGGRTPRSGDGSGNAPGAAPGPVPAGITQGGQEMSALVKSQAQGAIPGLYYDIKLNDLVKDMRTKYPGYGAEIDQTIRSITGITPANDIVNTLQGYATKQYQMWYDYQEQNQGIIKFLHPDWQGINDPKYSQAQIYNDVAQYRGEESRLDLGQKSANYALTQNQLTDRAVEDQANLLARTRGNQAMRGGLSAIGSNFTAADKTLKGLADGSIKIQDVDVAQLGAQLATAKAQLTSSVTQDLQSPLDPNDPNSKSLWDLLRTPEKRDAAIKTATANIDAMQQAVLGNDYGLVRALAAHMEAEKNGQLADLYKKYPVVQLIQSLSTAMGPSFGPWFENLMLNNKDLNDTLRELIHTAVSQGFASNPVTGKPAPVVGVKDLIDGASTNDPNVTPEIVRNFTKNNLKAINDPTTNPQVADKSVKAIFATKGGFDLTAFDDNEAHSIYVSLVNPQTTASIKRISDSTNDPSLWQNYTGWAYKNFNQVFQVEFNDIKATMQNPLAKGLVTTHYDPALGQFVVQKNDVNAVQGNTSIVPTGAASPPTFALKQMQDQLASNYLNINQALSAMSSVLKTDGKDMTNSITPYLNMLGVVGVAPAPPDATPGQQGSSRSDTGKTIQNASYTVNGSQTSGIDFVAKLEGFNSRAYADGSQYSIGYGTKATPDEIKNGTVLSQADAKIRLAQELDKAGSYVDKVIQVPLTANQHLALSSLVYNTGHLGQSLINDLNAGNYASVPNHIAQYTGTSVPGTEQGIRNRRAQEIQMWNSGGNTQVATNFTAANDNTKGPSGQGGVRTVPFNVTDPNGLGGATSRGTINIGPINGPGSNVNGGYGSSGPGPGAVGSATPWFLDKTPQETQTADASGNTKAMNPVENFLSYFNGPQNTIRTVVKTTPEMRFLDTAFQTYFDKPITENLTEADIQKAYAKVQQSKLPEDMQNFIHFMDMLKGFSKFVTPDKEVANNIPK